GSRPERHERRPRRLRARPCHRDDATRQHDERRRRRRRTGLRQRPERGRPNRFLRRDRAVRAALRRRGRGLRPRPRSRDAGGGGGIAPGEYLVAPDPGTGHATPTTVSGATLSAHLSGLAPGVYTVGVRARDGSGAWSSTATALLVVYDPTGGFATGGGWIVPGGPSSDPGDLLPGLDGAGKANFGFTVKYQKGTSTVPGGAFQFCYTAGKLHLKSAAFDWLVVTSTNWARFQGLATIDGAGGALYPFRSDARDGDPDRLVLRVWAPGADPSTAEPAYKASGDVSGGQVTIHK